MQKRRYTSTRPDGVKSQMRATLMFVPRSSVRVIYDYLPQIVWMTKKKAGAAMCSTEVDPSINP